MSTADHLRALGADPDAPFSALTASQAVDAIAAAIRQPDRAAPPDPARKYTYDEVRVRLATGRDPDALTDAEREAALADAVSAKTVQRMVRSGELAHVSIRSRPYVTETQVRVYERNLAEGRTRRRAQRRGGRTSVS